MLGVALMAMLGIALTLGAYGLVHKAYGAGQQVISASAKQRVLQAPRFFTEVRGTMAATGEAELRGLGDSPAVSLDPCNFGVDGCELDDDTVSGIADEDHLYVLDLRDELLRLARGPGGLAAQLKQALPTGLVFELLRPPKR